MVRVVLFIMIFSMWNGLTSSRHFDRCDLAETLQKDYGIETINIPDWVCLVASESKYNTEARHRNMDGSTDFGLFQINDKSWCRNEANPGGENICGIDCTSLLDDDITDDIACAETIYQRLGLYAWYGWTLRCTGTNVFRYTRGCNL